MFALPMSSFSPRFRWARLLAASFRFATPSGRGMAASWSTYLMTATWRWPPSRSILLSWSRTWTQEPAHASATLCPAGVSPITQTGTHKDTNFLHVPTNYLHIHIQKPIDFDLDTVSFKALRKKNIYIYNVWNLWIEIFWLCLPVLSFSYEKKWFKFKCNSRPTELDVPIRARHLPPPFLSALVKFIANLHSSFNAE